MSTAHAPRIAEHRHLLLLGSYQGIAIVSAADFMGLVAGL